MQRLLISLVFAASSVSALALDSAQPESATGFRSASESRGSIFMAVTANVYASKAATEILELGGGAVDAAIAAQWVLNVVEPQSSGIGGGGFLLFWDAKRRSVFAYDGRETAPHDANEDFALGADGLPIPFGQLVATGKSVGTPGLVAMLEMAHQTHGRLRWERLFRPAIRLAENGFPVSPRLHALLAADPFLPSDPVARKLYYPDGQALPENAWLVNPGLGATMRKIAAFGARSFYDGEVADAIVSAVRSRGGVLKRSDLAGYRPVLRKPVCGKFRQWQVCGMPPPSSGGLGVAQILGLLERKSPVSAVPEDVESAHLFAAAGRLAFADRARYVADPDFVDVPQQEMLDHAYLDQRARLMDRDQDRGMMAPGKLLGLSLLADAQSEEIPATTHLSVVDPEGNGVALTSSIESGFGSRIMVRGFLLNNQLTDFSSISRRDGKPVANRLASGKRPMSSMAPTVVLDSTGRMHALLGSSGGPRIINYTARALWAMLAANYFPSQVVAIPHVGNRNGPTELEEGTGAETLAGELARRGHNTVVVPMNSGLHVILRQGLHWVGAADPRREGVPIGR